MKVLVVVLTAAILALGGPALADQWGLTPPAGIDSATFSPMTVKFEGCDRVIFEVTMSTAKGGAFYYRFLHADGTRTPHKHFSDNGPAKFPAIDTLHLSGLPSIVIVEDTLEVYGTIYPNGNVAPFPPSGDPKTWKAVAHHKATHGCSPAPKGVKKPL
jgi:hypothetical protein